MKSIEKISVGVIIRPDHSSTAAMGRHSTAPTTIASGMAMLRTLR